jgi:cyclopropane fatty-acyl-phospholipid synthase-like methyltransferase
MDRWKYYDIVHRRHSVMNPVDETKLERLYDLLELNPSARVIDIGCGKGEMLIGLAEKYDIKGL